MGKKRSSRQIVSLVFFSLFTLCIGFILGSFILPPGIQTAHGKVNYSKVKLLEQYMDQFYLDEADEGKIEEFAYKGMVAGLGDPYSAYFTKDEYKEIIESLEGSYCGIGVLCSQDEKTGEVLVLKAFKKGGAYTAGIRAGDRIRKVEGKSILAEDLQTIITKIRGEEKTKVRLTVYQAETKKEKVFQVERRVIENETVTFEMLENKIGYIAVSEFDDVTVGQFKEAVDTLEKQGMKGLIIDLRNNGGGVLTSAQKMLDRLLPKCLLTYTVDKDGKKEKYFAEKDDKFTKPLVILVNGQSASASELFSGAIKDYGVGTLVGTKTFGKGIVQSIFPLSDGSAIKLTVAKYYTPKGVCIHGKGIQPDIKVELPKNISNPLNVPRNQDTQLKKAIQVVKNKIMKKK